MKSQMTPFEKLANKMNENTTCETAEQTIINAFQTQTLRLSLNDRYEIWNAEFDVLAARFFRTYKHSETARQEAVKETNRRFGVLAGASIRTVLG